MRRSRPPRGLPFAALALGASLGSALVAGGKPTSSLSSKQIVEQVAEAVVRIDVEDQASRMRHGSGFVVAGDGSVVTSLHVVDGAHRVGIVLHDGTALDEVAVRAFDVEADLVVLGVDSRLAAHGVKLGDTSQIEPGAKIVVMGSPLGFEQTVTEGLVSAWREPGASRRSSPGRTSSGSHPLLLLCRVLQISAGLSPGSSGGPVLDDRGKVIGVASSGVLQGLAGLNFAVPIDRLLPLLEEDDALDLGTFRKRVDATRLDLARPYFDKAELAYERREYGAAEGQVELALLAFPRYGQALLLWGRLAREQGRNDLAESRFLEATDADPENAEAWYALGEVLHQGALERNDATALSSAEQAYLHALDIDGWHTGAKYHLALIEAGRGNLERAEELLLAATTADPQFADAQALLGEIYLAQDRVNDAMDCFEKALWEDEDNARGHFGLAKLYTVTERDPFGTVPKHGRAEVHWAAFLRLSNGDPTLAAQREFAVAFVQQYFPHLLRR